MKDRIGIAVAGNILTDNVKIVQTYPEKGMLASIESESLAVGGCVPNTAIDIKKIDSSLTVKVYGKIGNDDKGGYVLSIMKEIGLNTDGVLVSKTSPTSYSDVITVKATGERTFFHNRGANKEFKAEDIDVDALDCKMFHIGYIMLLDSFDVLNADGSTPMSGLLKKISERGIKTSIDLVSESSGNFRKVATAAFPHCDYVIINEIEAGAIVGIAPRDEQGRLIDSNIEDILNGIMSCGVREKVIIHCPEKGFCMDKSGIFTAVESRKLPDNFIKGSVGAGDAFCAGCLYSLYNGYTDEDTLSFGNLVAVNCLSAADSVSGVTDKENLEKVLKF